MLSFRSVHDWSGVTTSEEQSPAALEGTVADLLRAMGHEVTQDVSFHGNQFDIVARRPVAGVGVVRMVVEIKQRSSRAVPIEEVRNFMASTGPLLFQGDFTTAMMVTNSRFSAASKSLVEADSRYRLVTLEDLEQDLRSSYADLSSFRRSGAAVDAGPALLEPVTRQEYAAIEGVLSVLWDAASKKALTEEQEQKILSIAGMIEKEQREAEPGKTPRWKLVGAMSAGLGFLLLQVPDGIIKWNDAWAILADIDWINVADLLRGR